MAIQSEQQQQPIVSATTTSTHPSSSTSAAKVGKKFFSIEEYQEALKKFSADDPYKENKSTESSSTFSSDNNSLVDDYFDFIAHTGRPGLPWELIRSAFLWKLERVINDMHIMEAEKQADDFLKEQLINNTEIKETRQFIIEKAKSFEGIPFTIQRLCELLIHPTKHYHRTIVFLHALEKNINVVSTITKDGFRVTGVDEPEAMDEEEGPILVERNFIVSVDECDEPLPKKLAMQQQYNGNSTGLKISEDNNRLTESSKADDNEMKTPIAMLPKNEEQCLKQEETMHEQKAIVEQSNIKMEED